MRDIRRIAGPWGIFRIVFEQHFPRWPVRVVIVIFNGGHSNYICARISWVIDILLDDRANSNFAFCSSI